MASRSAATCASCAVRCSASRASAASASATSLNAPTIVARYWAMVSSQKVTLACLRADPSAPMPISRRPAAHVEGSTLAPTDRHGGARPGIAGPFAFRFPWTCWLLGRASDAHPPWYGGCEERRTHATNRAERRTEDEAMLVEAPAGDGDAACASRHGRGGRRREELQLPAGRHRRGVPGHHGAD